MLERCRRRQCCREPAVLADETKEMYWKNSFRCSGYGAR